MTSPPWTMREAAASLGLSPSRLRQLAIEGRIPGAFRPGGPTGHWRFDPEKLAILKEPAAAQNVVAGAGSAAPRAYTPRPADAEAVLAYELLIRRKNQPSVKGGRRRS